MEKKELDVILLAIDGLRVETKQIVKEAIDGLRGEMRSSFAVVNSRLDQIENKLDITFEQTGRLTERVNRLEAREPRV